MKRAPFATTHPHGEGEEEPLRSPLFLAVLTLSYAGACIAYALSGPAISHLSTVQHLTALAWAPVACAAAGLT